MSQGVLYQNEELMPVDLNTIKRIVDDIIDFTEALRGTCRQIETMRDIENEASAKLIALGLKQIGTLVYSVRPGSFEQIPKKM